MSPTLLSFTLPIAEVFTSTASDPPMTFVRLASPDDTDYRNMDIVKITSFIPPHIRHVNISGGGPLVHVESLGVLISELTFSDVTIHLEITGAVDPPHYWKLNDHIHWSFSK
jgi:organic radical activating enzyme